MKTSDITVIEAFEHLILAQKYGAIVREGQGLISTNQAYRIDKVTQNDDEFYPHFSFNGPPAANMAGRIQYGAVGDYSASFNGRSAALGKHSFTINNSTIAKGEESFAQGYETIAEGNSSFAGGSRTWARGVAAASLGSATQALGEASFATGSLTIAEGTTSFAVGNGSIAWGESANAEGTVAKAYGHSSHAEGSNTIAGIEGVVYDGTQPEESDECQNLGQHAEGIATKAIKKATHAEGYCSEALEEGAHAEGYSFAFGKWAHSENWQTRAVGRSSHTEGEYTSTGNIIDIPYYDITSFTTSYFDSTYVKMHLESPFSISEHYIGKTFTAYVVDRNGKLYSKYKSIIETTEDLIYFNEITIFFANAALAKEAASILGSEAFLRMYVEPIDFVYDFNINGGQSAHAEGYNSKALFNYSHAEGNSTLAVGVSAHTEGTYTISHNAHGHAEGLRTITVGNGAHAEGNGGEAALSESIQKILESGDATAIANTWNTNKNFSAAIGQGSHVEGLSTMASGAGAHAEGYQTSAWADYSHAAGLGTRAIIAGQTVIGKYNKEDYESLFVIGDGDSDLNRKNAFAVGYDIDGYYYAKIGDKYYTDRRNYLITASIYMSGGWCYCFSFETRNILQSAHLSNKSSKLEYLKNAMEDSKAYPCSEAGIIKYISSSEYFILGETSLEFSIIENSDLIEIVLNSIEL